MCMWFMDVILALIFVTFSTLPTSSFSDLRFFESVVTVGTLCRNSSHNFIPTFFKLGTCFPHGQEICMWFWYNPWIKFCYFFHFVKFVIFWPQILWKCRESGYLVSATPHTILYRRCCHYQGKSLGLEPCLWRPVFWQMSQARTNEGCCHYQGKSSGLEPCLWRPVFWQMSQAGTNEGCCHY